MRPARGLSRSWLNNLPRERRNALFSLAVLLVLLGSLVVYQRYTLNSQLPLARPQHGTASRAGDPVRGAEPVSTPEAAASAEQAPPPVTRLNLPLGGQHKRLITFGFAYSEIYQDFRLNPGIDYQATEGEAVLAAGPGTVAAIEQDPIDGGTLVLNHGHGLATRYSGLGKVLVSLNAKVESGSSIAEVGKPGPARQALGTHLHFEVRRNGEPIDPNTLYGP